MQRSPRIAILGSGMAGMGASERFRESGLTAQVYDKHPYPGGHTASHRSGGFVFDEGPHVSFTKNERFKKLLARSVDNAYLKVDASINNYWQGYWIRHPAITNLYGLPSELVTRIIKDFVASQELRDQPIRHYLDWLYATYGRTFAETFPARYTIKYHTTAAENLATDWLGPRLYPAKLEEVLMGALSATSPNVHYVQDYRYPTHDGFAAFLRVFQQGADLRLNHEIIGINWECRQISLAGGRTIDYDELVSSIPLPDLIGMLHQAPRDVARAAELLACTSVVLVNLGVGRPDVSCHSWNYYYDDEFPFSRVSYPRVMSPHVVPDGMSSIQAEVYFSKKYRPLSCHPDELIQPTIEGLTRAGVLRADDRITFRQAMLIPYANIIFDLDRIEALRTVHGFLDSIGIQYCGRYGDWGYLWTDEAYESGERAAQRILDRMTSTTSRGTAA